MLYRLWDSGLYDPRTGDGGGDRWPDIADTCQACEIPGFFLERLYFSEGIPDGVLDTRGRGVRGVGVGGGDVIQGIIVFGRRRRLGGTWLPDIWASEERDGDVALSETVRFFYGDGRKPFCHLFLKIT